MIDNLFLDDIELSVIQAMLLVSIRSVNSKRHKTRQDIKVVNELKKIENKINEYFKNKKG